MGHGKHSRSTIPPRGSRGPKPAAAGWQTLPRDPLRCVWVSLLGIAWAGWCPYRSTLEVIPEATYSNCARHRIFVEVLSNGRLTINPKASYNRFGFILLLSYPPMFQFSDVMFFIGWFAPLGAGTPGMNTLPLPNKVVVVFFWNTIFYFHKVIHCWDPKLWLNDPPKKGSPNI